LLKPSLFQCLSGLELNFMSSGSAHIYHPVNRILCHTLRSTPLASDMMICMMS
jgi:hypothetical protein